MESRRTFTVDLVIQYSTLGWLWAGVGDGAGVDTVVIVAGLLSGAIKIRPAIHCEAGHVWVSFKPWGTRAHRFMADGFTDRFSSAGNVTRSTDRAALFVPTGVGVQTIVVYFAFDLETSNVWVPLVSFLTGTHGLVIDDSAEGMVSAGTRVFAQLVDAGVTGAAFIIGSTASQYRGQGLAAGIIIAYIAVRTGTDHGPYWEGVDHRTARRTGAGVQSFAEKFTFVVETGMFGWTILVFHTFWCWDG